MTIAFRSHLDTHEMITQRIGAGLVRHTCTICDHIAVSAVDEPSVGAAVIPDWMAAAAARFAGVDASNPDDSTIDDEPVEVVRKLRLVSAA